MLNVQTHNEVYNEDGFGTELDIYDLEKGMFSGAFSEENTEFKFVFLPKDIEFEDSNKNYDRIFFRNEEIYFYRYDDIIGTLTEQPVDIIDLSSGDYSGIADDYVCGAVERFSKKGGKVMLRDSQLWMKIGRICTLLAKRLDISPERAFDIFQMSKTNELLHDERSLLYLMSDLYIVDDVIMELQSADGLHRIYKQNSSNLEFYDYGYCI